MLASQATRRLRSAVGEDGVVAPIAAAPMVVLVPDLKHADDATLTADSIHMEMTRAHLFRGEAYFLQCSVGLAMYPEHGRTPERLLNNADAALCRTGESTGDHFKSYDAVEHANNTERLLIKTALHQAIEGGELQLRYQPRFSTQTGALLGAEVLLRWFNPVLGNVPPADFIPVAEDTGHIMEIGRWVLQQAMSQYRTWKAEGYILPALSVNISGPQLERGGLLDTLEQLEVSKLPEGMLLELELTERLLVGSTARSRDTLEALNNRGVRLAIDDFGTGYSALSYLTELPVSVVKLDHSLVRNIHRSDESATLVKSILALAHDLNMQVVAEGVEEEDQLSLLRELGCDEVQGFLVATPATAEGMEKLLPRG